MSPRDQDFHDRDDYYAHRKEGTAIVGAALSQWPTMVAILIRMGGGVDPSMRSANDGLLKLVVDRAIIAYDSTHPAHRTAALLLRKSNIIAACTHAAVQASLACTRTTALSSWFEAAGRTSSTG